MAGRTSPLVLQQGDLLHHKNPMVLRMGDHSHSKVQIGDIVHLEGHSSIMDRQKFKVVATMKHPTLNQALNSIQHSDVSVRDKIAMRNAFTGFHGAAAQHGPVTAIHLAPHPSSMIGGANHTVSF